MKKILPILLLLLCSACGTAHRDYHAVPTKTQPPAKARHPANPPRPTNSVMNDLVIFAMSMAGIPYHYGGSSPKTGFDCSGLVHYVYDKSLQIRLPRTTSGLSRVGKRLQKKQLLPGDLVFFNTQHRSYSHVGIYVGENRFVHAPRTGKTISIANMLNSYWRTHYDGARRVTIRR